MLRETLGHRAILELVTLALRAAQGPKVIPALVLRVRQGPRETLDHKGIQVLE